MKIKEEPGTGKNLSLFRSKTGVLGAHFVRWFKSIILCHAAVARITLKYGFGLPNVIHL
jgi:hypothetical protein